MTAETNKHIHLPSLSLRKLAERLNEIVAENEQRGWSARNDSPVVLELLREGKTRMLRSRFFPIDHASSALLTLRDGGHVMTIAARERDERS